MTSKKFLNDVLSLIQDADTNGLLLESIGLSGYSGNKLIGALQRIAKYQNENDNGVYLEIGVFQGLSLVSVGNAAKNGGVYGIDNFAYFDPKGKNKQVVLDRISQNDRNNIFLIESDYEDALNGLRDPIGDEKVGLYFIDGPHDYRSQLMCLLLARDHLSEKAVVVIDDCNYRHVRQANRDFLQTNSEFKLIYEAYTRCHPRNMNLEEYNEAKKGWWNGVNVIVFDPFNELEEMYPDTQRDRLIFENENLTHAAKYSFLAPLALEFVDSIKSFKLISAFKQFLKLLFKNRGKISADHKGTYSAMNTFSEALTNGAFNKIKQ